MIRVLIMITVVGFVLSLGALSAAFAIGGPDAIARGGWSWAGGDWKGKHWGWDDDDHAHPVDPGPEVTRTLAWSGAETLDIDLLADVRYVQAPGPTTVTVTGHERDVNRVVVRGDSIGYSERHGRNRGRVTILIRAPSIHSFDLAGASTLAIEGYSQDRLDLDLSGNAEVTATGRTDALLVDMSGSSEADLGGLTTKTATVDASGAAEATVAPTDRAQVEVSGAAEVNLLTRPAALETDISGAGRLRQLEPPALPAKGAKL